MSWRIGLWMAFWGLVAALTLALFGLGFWARLPFVWAAELAATWFLEPDLGIEPRETAR